MPSARGVVAACAVVTVLGTVAGTLYLLGSPAEERVHRLDERRVHDLRAIAGSTNVYWTRHRRLPASLTELSREPGFDITSRDPVTAEPYAYRAVDPTSYELCGSFERHSSNQDIGRVAEGFWSHGAGKQCFVVKVREIPR